jgi:hypothetical protein
MPVEGHDIYFHLRIIMGLVVGLALTRMLSGVAKFITHRDREHLYAAHLIWIATIILMAVHFWWFEYGLIRIQPWTFDLFVFVLFYAFLFFLLATILLPDDIVGYEDYREYFMSRRQWFFGLLALTVPIDLIDTLAKGPEYYRSYGPEYPVRLIGLLLLCAAGAWSRKLKVQTWMAALYLTYFISWILRSYRILE